VVQDCLLQTLQLRAGLEAQVIRERSAGLGEDVERLALAARAVERQHQLRSQPFPQRMLPHQRTQLGRELGMAAQSEVGIDARADRVEPAVLEVCDRLARERLVLEVGQRTAAPEVESLAQEARGRCGVTGGEGCASGPDTRVEPL